MGGHVLQQTAKSGSMILTTITTPKASYVVHEEDQGDTVWWYTPGGLYFVSPVAKPITQEQRDDAVVQIRAQIADDEANEG